MNKEVKIIGLSVKENFGMLKATELKFNEDLRLTTFKGEVGAGKTTVNKAMRLTTQGSATLEDSKLYGSNVNLEAQLTDGDHKIFIGCKSDKEGKLTYTLYELDANGKKVNNPVIDGVKATPAAYLNQLSTALTWRLNELTSENPTVQRNLLLELYANELERQGVVFNKKSPRYVGGIIDQIEKAKNERNILDSKRKEVGGIASDLINKGIDIEETYTIKNTDAIKEQITTLKVETKAKQGNAETVRKNELNELKLKGLEYANELKKINEAFISHNIELQTKRDLIKAENQSIDERIGKASNILIGLINSDELTSFLKSKIKYNTDVVDEDTQVLLFNERGSIISDPKDWENTEVVDLLLKYRDAGIKYSELSKRPIEEVNTDEEEKQLEELERSLKNAESYNKDALAVISFQKWRDADQKVKDLNKDYYLKLTEINTGVKGLHIVPEDNDIFLTYNGEYDVDYFHNPNKELRKLSAYSDTQKPMICLLIQNYLLSKKTKKLPYLWIDQVPIDKKTKALLDKMSEELGLYLFVNWTGDFSVDELQEGEILIENGEVFFKE